MKKLYFLFLMLLTVSLSFGQASDLYFSMYAEGSSNNKFLEIYNGTGADVDLADYSIELYSNGNTSAGYTLTFTAGTILTDGDVYVIYNSSADATIVAAGDVASTVTYYNGDDAIALLKTGAVIDVIGEIGVDPGSSWTVGSTSGATANHTLIRKPNICSPNPNALGSFGSDDATSEWLVGASDSGWGDLGSHTGCIGSPTISITTPSDGNEFTPGTTSVDVEWTTTNTAGTETVDLTVNGTTYNGVSSPYSITTTDGQTYNVTVELVDGGVIDSDMVSFSIGSISTVSDIAALRAGTIGNTYQLTGEAIISYIVTENTRNQKYIQDATGGILIDDPSGTISTVFNIGDGMTGIQGQLSEYSGVLQFVPIANVASASSTGNTITPQEISAADLLNNGEDYESELIKVVNVTFADAGGTFTDNSNYNIIDATDGTTTTVCRVSFGDENLIGSTIPSVTSSVIGLGAEFNTTYQVLPRYLLDVEGATLSSEEFAFNNLAIYPNPTSTGFVTINSNNAEVINAKVFDILGKQVLDSNVNNNQLNVSDLNAGVYILKLSQGNATVTKKLVIK